ncbi:MAG: MBL fold metallo-hydrolase [Gammaproteobacteria bacterium]|jgi:glyoxylase-like metal-dependent hydrolase (beta-lactamase superfamily II)|nr:MBL fold metallo-hydrolase [Gammaproteobacteria bacterium]MBT6665751.1 MBL fold metallo-hydrolase [Gammaproteobacteria bacterium]MBT7723187.1 MBL fold metallo-hydrolase [Gammaproteobacteria bacterium]
MHSKNQTSFLTTVALILLALCGCEKQELTGAPTALDGMELVFSSIKAMGGSEQLGAANTLSFKSDRDYYIMGQGPGPGQGLMKLARSEMTVRRDVAADKLRLDTVAKFAARGGGYTERKSHELIVGDDGYLHDAGFLGLLKDADRALPADRMASTLKTEYLLNPQVILQAIVADPTLISADQGVGVHVGRLFNVEEAMPVTLDRVRQTGKRVLLVTDDWLEQSEDTEFHGLMVERTEIDSDWLKSWRATTSIEVDEHHKLVINNDVYPITLYFDKQTGLLKKLHTLEWDVVYGDVSLDVSYEDWRVVDGISFPHRVLMSYGGAPRIEVTRSEVLVNPEFDVNIFMPPEGVEYVHDEAVARRSRMLSQSLLMFGFAGVGRPTIESIQLSPEIQLLYAAPKDGVFTMVVELENSLVVVEPGQNDLKGEVIIDRLAQQYPDKPISHLIVSHHHNDHAAGIRPYIAAGAKLVVHEAAVDFYKMQTSREPSVVLQDALDRNPQAAQIVGVAASSPVRIEDSRLPVVVYHLEMGHVPDMVFVFVEGENLLYGGDLYISGLARDLRSGKKRPANILPFHAAQSLDDGIREYGLEVATLVGSHDQQSVVYQDLINYLTDE